MGIERLRVNRKTRSLSCASQSFHVHLSLSMCGVLLDVTGLVGMRVIDRGEWNGVLFLIIAMVFTFHPPRGSSHEFNTLDIPYSLPSVFTIHPPYSLFTIQPPYSLSPTLHVHFSLPYIFTIHYSPYSLFTGIRDPPRALTPAVALPEIH